MAPAAAAVLVALPGLATVLTAVYAPTRTAFDNVLVLLPVTEQRRRAVVRWFSTTVGLLLGGVWALPFGLQVLLASPTSRMPLVALCIAGLMAGGALATQLIVELVGRALDLIVVADSPIGRAAAGVVAALAAAGALIAAIPGPGSPAGAGPLALFGALFRDVVTGARPALGVAVIGALPLALLAVTGILEWLPRPVRRPDPIGLSVPTARAGKGLIGLEVVQWLRYPMNATLLIFVCGFTASAVLAWGRSGTTDQWFTVSLLLLAVVSTAGVGAYGATREHHWLYHTTRRPSAWISPKLIASTLVWAFLVSSVGLILWLFTPWRPSDVVVLMPGLAVEFLAGCLIGLAIPANREQSLSASLTEAVAALGCMSVTVGVYSLPFATASYSGYLTTCSILAVLLLTLYVVIGRRRDRENVTAG
jgi:hypothetical protein